MILGLGGNLQHRIANQHHATAGNHRQHDLPQLLLAEPAPQLLPAPTPLGPTENYRHQGNTHQERQTQLPLPKAQQQQQ